MTVSTTYRLGLTRWSDDNDAWSRAQFTSIIDQLESTVAIAAVGLDSAKGNQAAAGRQRSFYFSTDQRLLYFSTGTVWEALPVMTNTAQQNFVGTLTALNNKVITKNEVGSAAPTTGTWVSGDKVWNQFPTTSGVIGWVCVSGGTPGTWRTWGAVGAT